MTRKTYHFELTLRLPNSGRDPNQWLDALYKAGCDDSVVGVGQYGAIGLLFARQAESAKKSIDSAIESVRKAIPESALIEVSPDQIGLTEIAMLFGISRQAAYKLGNDPESGFPLPMYSKSSALWHQCDVLSWAAQACQPIQCDDPYSVYEVSQYALKVNQDIQRRQTKHIKKQALKAFKSEHIGFVLKEDGKRRKRTAV